MSWTRNFILIIILSSCIGAEAKGKDAIVPVTVPTLDDYYVSGRAALEDELFELAQKQFQEYLANDKSSATNERYFEVTSLLMESLHLQDKDAKIIKFAESLAKSWKKYKRSDEILYWTAVGNCELGEHDKALKLIDQFEEIYTKSRYAGRMLRIKAWCSFKLGDTDAALKYFSKFSKKYNKDPENNLNLLEWGKILLDKKRPVEAQLPLERLTKDPATSDAVVNRGRYFLAQSFILQKKWTEAEAVLMNMVKKCDLNSVLLVRVWSDLATVQEELGRPDDAIVSLNNMIQSTMDPENKYKGSLRLGYLYMKKGKIEEGLPLLKSMIAENADTEESECMQLFLAEELLNQGHTDDSIKEYHHYLETYTNTAGKAKAYQGKGWGLMGLERYAEAAGSFMKAYELFDSDTDKASSLYKAGDAYYSNKQFTLAQDMYTRLLDAFSDTILRSEILFQLGECSMRLDKPEEAEKYFREIASKFVGNPTAEEALLMIATVKVGQQEWKKAIAVFDELMKKYPESTFYVDALYGKAMANYRTFDFNSSLEALDKILSDFPNSDFVEQSYFQRGMCWYWLGQDAKALVTCSSFLDKYPESSFVPEVLFWLGKYYYNHGDFEQAENRMRSFADKYKTLPLADDALYWAAIAAFKRKEYLKSIEFLNTLLKDYPQSRKTALARFAQAEALSMIDKSSAAILVFDEIINKYPESGLVASAWGRKGDCQFILGSDDLKRYEESIDSYKIVVGNIDSEIDLILQAEYKIGRSLEKLGKIDEAFEQYYNQVVLRYFVDKEKGINHNEASKMWFTRAAFNAADILEAKHDLRRVISILNRIIDAKVGSDELAQERIKKIRSEQWWLFY